MISQLLCNFQYNSTYSDWSKSDKGEVHRDLISYIYKLDKDDAPRQANYHKNLMLYSNTHINNLYAGYKLLPSLKAPMQENRVVYNIARSATNTVAAKISKNKIKMNVVTDAADFTLQYKAKKLDAAIWSMMYANEFHELAKMAFMDACIGGTGIIHVMKKNNKVCYERVLPFEILVDELDAIYGKPNKLYRYKLISLDSLISLFPDKKTQIENTNKINSIGNSSISASTIVYEAWDLSANRHVICIEGVDLLDEDFMEKEFPFLFLHYSAPQIGFWGTGLVDEISAFQVEINKLLFFVQKSMHLNSAPKWFVQPNSMPKNLMSNEIGSIIPINGAMPQYIAPQPIHSQVIQQIEMLKNEAYAQAGISQMSSRSEKPAGITAGIALTTLSDIESQRFVLIGQAYEKLFLDCFKRTVDICKEIYAEDKSFAIVSSNNYGMEKIIWSEVDLDRDLYQIKVFPASALPQEPAARLQRLTEFVQNGFITKEQFLELADLPDLKQSSAEMYSSTTVVKSILDKMLRTKTYTPPTKYIDLQLASKLSLNLYNSLVIKEAPVELQELVLQWLDECQGLIQLAQQEQALAQQMLNPEQVPE